MHPVKRREISIDGLYGRIHRIEDYVSVVIARIREDSREFLIFYSLVSLVVDS